MGNYCVKRSTQSHDDAKTVSRDQFSNLCNHNLTNCLQCVLSDASSGIPKTSVNPILNPSSSQKHEFEELKAHKRQAEVSKDHQ